MAAPRKVDPTADFDSAADVTKSPEDWEWETVAEGTPTGIVFETPGESFIGQYQEKRHIDREPAADGSDQSFDIHVYKGRDGELYSLPDSYALANAMSKVQPLDWCRVTYLKSVKTGRGLNDMKDYKVDVRK